MDAVLVVGELRDWPDSELERVYRLLGATIARRSATGSSGDADDDLDLAGDAEQFGLELVRRGLI